MVKALLADEQVIVLAAVKATAPVPKFNALVPVNVKLPCTEIG